MLKKNTNKYSGDYMRMLRVG